MILTSRGEHLNRLIEILSNGVSEGWSLPMIENEVGGLLMRGAIRLEEYKNIVDQAVALGEYKKRLRQEQESMRRREDDYRNRMIGMFPGDNRAQRAAMDQENKAGFMDSIDRLNRMAMSRNVQLNRQEMEEIWLLYRGRLRSLKKPKRNMEELMKPVETANPKQPTAHHFGYQNAVGRYSYPEGAGSRRKPLREVNKSSVPDYNGKGDGNDLFEKPNGDVLICDNPVNGCGRQLELLEDYPDMGIQIWRCPAGLPDYIVRYQPKQEKKKEEDSRKVEVDTSGNVTLKKSKRSIEDNIFE